MADKKSGPVKPPIIDAKARSAGGSDDTTTPKTTPDATASGTVKPDAPAPSTPTASASAAPKPAEAAVKASPTAPATASEATPKPGVSEPSAVKPEATKPSPTLSGPDAAKADPAKPDAQKPGAPKPEAPKPTSPSGAASLPPTRSAASAVPLAPLAVTAGAGALIGLALAYGLASFDMWPATDNTDPSALADLESRTAGIEEAIGEQQAQTADATSRIDALESNLATRFDEIAGATPATEGLAAQSDLDALSSQIEEVSTRLDALAAGASGDESSQIAGQINALSEDLATLTERLGAIEPQIADIAPAVEDAQTRLDDLDARIVDQPAFDAVSADRDRFARLPAALDALEDAINSGAPFASELAETESLLPSLSVPEDARALAASGVSSSSQLLADFRTAIPAILAARPQDPEANWAQSLLDQAASAIALRPTDGDGPQATVGRVETALETGDLAAAQENFSALPDPMRSAAGGFGTDLDNAIAATTLLSEARATSPASTQPEAAQ